MGRLAGERKKDNARRSSRYLVSLFMPASLYREDLDRANIIFRALDR